MNHRRNATIARWAGILLILAGIIAEFMDMYWTGTWLVYAGFWGIASGWCFTNWAIDDEQEQKDDERHAELVKASKEALQNSKIVESIVCGWPKSYND